MAQLFPHWSNTLARLATVAIVAFIPLLAAALMIAVRTPYYTGEGIAPQQPVPFSHEHHVGDLNIDCRYCHTSVEESAFAGMPPTHTCMTCHSQLWTHAEALKPVRESLAHNQSLRWQRVYDLPDYVYFDHSIHVNKGIGCESCHGRIDKMPLTHSVTPLSMTFCLDCHRQPQASLRPQSAITTMGWQARTGMLETLTQHYSIRTIGLTDCSVCHR